MIEEFGESYSEILKRDLHLHELADKTANELLAEGEDPKAIWLALKLLGNFSCIDERLHQPSC